MTEIGTGWIESGNVFVIVMIVSALVSALVIVTVTVIGLTVNGYVTRGADMSACCYCRWTTQPDRARCCGY